MKYELEKALEANGNFSIKDISLNADNNIVFKPFETNYLSSSFGLTAFVFLKEKTLNKKRSIRKEYRDHFRQ
jgi:hypothetical protein